MVNDGVTRRVLYAAGLAYLRMRVRLTVGAVCALAFLPLVRVWTGRGGGAIFAHALLSAAMIAGALGGAQALILREHLREVNRDPPDAAEWWR